MTNAAVIPGGPQQGYGKAIIGGLIQPFAGALSVVVLAIVEAKVGHPLGTTIDAAVSTLIETPLTLLAIIFTPHNLFSGGGN